MYCLTYSFVGSLQMYKVWKKKEDTLIWHLHRKSVPKPCYEHSNGVVEWWYEGMKYEVCYTEFSKEIKVVIGFKTDYIYTNHSYNDCPSVIYDNGTKEWHFYGRLHRPDNLPAIEYPNGDKEYWYDGKRHRDDGPAVIYGDKQYFFERGEFIKCIL